MYILGDFFEDVNSNWLKMLWLKSYCLTEIKITKKYNIEHIDCL